MAFPIAVTYTFGPMTGSIPLSDLDSNFSTLVTSLNNVSSGTLPLVTPALGTPASGTLTNATGLPISTGVSGLGTGVATFLSTPTSTNLRTVVSDETGTGSLVFATSPTLVTPVLGTPTSGTLTNCTGLLATGGGTGQSTYAVGDLLVGGATNTLAKLADVATGNALISGGVGVAPSYGKIGLTTHVSGTLPVGNGGTGITTTPTNGQLLIGNGTNYTVASLATTNGITATTGAGTLTIGSAVAGGKTANTTVANTITYTTAGNTLASQTMTSNAVWRIRAFGQFTAASSATVRNAQIACFWGTTQLTAIASAVLVGTAQTTQWQVEFTITGSSTTAAWVAGTLMNRTASATALSIDNATPASTTVTSGAQTLDLRVSMSASVAGDSWIVQSVTMERLV